MWKTTANPVVSRDSYPQAMWTDFCLSTGERGNICEGDSFHNGFFTINRGLWKNLGVNFSTELTIDN